MPILDSHVHAYERNHSRRPWIGTLYGPPEVSGDQMVTEANDAVAHRQTGLSGCRFGRCHSMCRSSLRSDYWSIAPI